MVDYTRTTGTTGTMMIRDLGSTIEFWFKAGYSNDYWNGMSFTVTANGSADTFTVNYSTGAAWLRVRTKSVTSTQTITFRLNTATGTNGMGGPTSFSQYIDRGSPPGASSVPTISSIGSTQAIVSFSDGSNGGLPIDTRQIGYGTSGTYPSTLVTSDRSTLITGLTPGVRYYAWARAHNSKGWGPWGPRATFVTLRVPDVPSSVTFSGLTQTSVITRFTGNGNGGSAVTGWQLAYNTANTTAGATIVASGGTLTVTGLEPGTTYYFWSRGQNAVGWSGWSPVKSTVTIAGAWIKVGLVWKQAVPYVRVGGVWKVARPWARVAGVWKESA